MQPVVISCVFWGAPFRQRFLAQCMRSLSAPLNWTRLGMAGVELLVICPHEDWQALWAEPLFSRLNAQTKVRSLPLPGRITDPKMAVMSRGHAIAAQHCYERRALSIPTTPDMLISDGALDHVLRHYRAGKAVVLAAATRFSEEGMTVALENAVLTPRVLTAAAVRNMHTETLSWEFDAPWFTHYPIVPWWRVDDDTVIVHSLSWAPLLLDYGALDRHDATTFQNWTMDGDYVYRNWGRLPLDRIHVVTDSDEIMVVGLTPDAQRARHLDTQAWGDCPVTKTRAISRLYGNSNMDDVKRWAFQKPVIWHGKDVPDAALEVMRRTRVISGVAAHGGPTSSPCTLPLMTRLKKSNADRKPRLARMRERRRQAKAATLLAAPT